MPLYQKTDLLKVILRIFPNAVVLERKLRKQESTISAEGVELAKRANPPRVDSRACKRQILHSRQTLLFNDHENESKPQNDLPSPRQSLTIKTDSSKPKIAYHLIAGRVIPYLIKEGVAHD